ncbi:MAG: hypothetical protein HC933_04300 [Pleurocapsa sp. SU_196_0]|nr:hypothetical protein [Pleurocapsa sp. SU_196_0]
MDFVSRNPSLAARATAATPEATFEAPNQTNPPSTTANNVQSSSSSGNLYTIAQLSAIVELAKRRTSGSVRDKRDAASAALQRLGTVYVSGLVTNGSILNFDSADRKAKYSLQCTRMERDFEDLGLENRVVLVRGNFKRVSSTSTIEMQNCEVQASRAGLQASNQSDKPGIDGGEWLTAPGQGLKPAQIDGVYLKLETGFDGWGNMETGYNTYLFLKDGWVYNDPDEPPSDLDVVASKSLESNRWGRWERRGGQVLIRWNDEPGKTRAYAQKEWVRAQPAQPGLRLEGTYKHATDSRSPTSVDSWRTVQLMRNGSFTIQGNAKRGIGAGGSGSYTLDGYTATFKFSDGRVKRTLFCAYPPENQYKVIVLSETPFLR